MPEIISKYPEITMQVLESAGTVCGEGAVQRILTTCPVDRFCSFPGGEVCVYGLHDIGIMTQITKPELAQAIGEITTVGVGFGSIIFIGLVSLVVGSLIGYFIKFKKK